MQNLTGHWGNALPISAGDAVMADVASSSSVIPDDSNVTSILESSQLAATVHNDDMPFKASPPRSANGSSVQSDSLSPSVSLKGNVRDTISNTGEEEQYVPYEIGVGTNAIGYRPPGFEAPPQIVAANNGAQTTNKDNNNESAASSVRDSNVMAGPVHDATSSSSTSSAAAESNLGTVGAPPGLQLTTSTTPTPGVGVAATSSTEVLSKEDESVEHNLRPPAQDNASGQANCDNPGSSSSTGLSSVTNNKNSEDPDD